MSQFVPVDLTNTTLEAISETLGITIGVPDGVELFDFTQPTKLSDLPNTDLFTSVLSIDAAAKLGVPIFGSAEGKLARRIVVQEFLRFVDDKSSTPVKRWGVGIRWIVNAKSLSAEAKVSSLSFLSASAQIGTVEATSKFQLVGIQSDAINAALPTRSNLDVEAYVEFQQAFDKIKNLITAPETQITPQVVGILAEVKPSTDETYEAALATGWGLSKIDEGRSLQQALDEFKSGSVFFEDTVRSVYLDVAKTTDPLQKPGAEVRARAHRLLNGLRVRL